MLRHCHPPATTNSAVLKMGKLRIPEPKQLGQSHSQKQKNQTFRSQSQLEAVGLRQKDLEGREGQAEGWALLGLGVRGSPGIRRLGSNPT